MTRVLVTGANGFVGSALIARLAADQRFAPIAVMRRADVVPARAERLVVSDLAELKLDGVDGIIHCAARVHVLREHAADPLAAFRRDNVETTLLLAEDAARAGVKRFVFLSSVKANGEETPGAPFTEQTPEQPETPYGQSKLEAERGLQEIAQRTHLEVAIIRPPLVYAASAGGNFARLLAAVYRGLPLPLASINNRRSYIARDNLVDFCIACVDHPNAANETFLVSDGDDLATPDMLRLIASGMGKSARLLPFSVALIKLAAGTIGLGEAARQVCGSLAVDSTKARKQLGWKPPVSVNDALSAAGRDYARHKN